MAKTFIFGEYPTISLFINKLLSIPDGHIYMITEPNLLKALENSFFSNVKGTVFLSCRQHFSDDFSDVAKLNRALRFYQIEMLFKQTADAKMAFERLNLMNVQIDYIDRVRQDLQYEIIWLNMIDIGVKLRIALMRGI